MRIDPFQFSSVLLFSSSGWSAIFASLPGTGKASTYRLSSSRHSSVLTGGGRDGVSSHSNVKNDFSLSRENIQNFGKSPSSPSHDFVLYPSNDFHEYSTVNLSIQNYSCRTILIKSTISNHPLKLWPSLGFHEKCSNNEKGREERSKQPALHTYL